MLSKKFLASAAVLAGLTTVAYHSNLGSYAEVAWSKLCATAKREVPVEFEIDRVRHEVGQLVPEMKRQLSILAEEMVAVDRLREEIVVAKANLEKQKANILTMKKDLQGGAETISYDGRSYSAARVREKLNRDFEVYKRADAELKTREALLEARERSLDTVREQLATMKSVKQELELRIAQLEAKLKAVRLAQTRNRFQFDDSKLSRCKQSLAEIEQRLDVESTHEKLQAEFTEDPIPVEKKDKTASQLGKEIDSYFAEPAGKVASKDAK